MSLPFFPFLHLTSYGILLGSQFFQTFLNGIIAFKSLSRPNFSLHQAAIFPVYFSLQAFLPVIVGLTAPATLSGSIDVSDLSYASLSLSWLGGWDSDVSVHGHVHGLMGGVSVAGLINLVVFRPLTQGVVRERRMQEVKDKKRDDTLLSPSSEWVALHRRFLVIHGTSILVNVCGLVVTGLYGVALGKRLS